MAIYNASYGLRAAPFSLNPDPRFLFLSRRHREALAGLMYAVFEAKGFVTLTGEVGTGKTTIVHTLLQELGAHACTAVVFNPNLSRADLYAHLLAEFKLPPENSIIASIRALQAFLLEQFQAGVRVVLVIDEAHALPREVLEEVRLLCNLETSQAKLLQVLLVGQPELRERLERPDLRQLRQRIALRFELAPFGFAETVTYVRWRLRATGANGDFFAPRAYSALYQFSGGVPRLINVLCDNALLLGFARDRRQIGRQLVRLAARDLRLRSVRRVGPWQVLGLRARKPAETSPPALPRFEWGSSR